MSRVYRSYVLLHVPAYSAVALDELIQEGVFYKITEVLFVILGCEACYRTVQVDEGTSNMGNTTTKFRKALMNGDENLACQIYESNPQLKETLDPNTSYGETYQHNTPLHYAARHGMNRILG